VAKNKFYVVWVGHQTGIFTDWATCSKHVRGAAGAKYKSFPTREEAEAAFKNGPSSVSKTQAQNNAVSNGVETKTNTHTSANGSSVSSQSSLKKKPGKPNSVETWNAAAIAKITDDTLIYTDGGCEPNPGEAGSGLAIYRHGSVDELWFGLYNPNGTNNTAELNALHQALIIASNEIERNRSVTILCDSKYAIQCVTQWAFNWKRKGWTKSGGEIKNLEIIKQLFALYESMQGQVNILHVNGHVGVEGNELADRMSILAMQERNTEFKLYPNTINVDEILALRAG